MSNDFAVYPSDPKCRGCNVVVEYNSDGYRWGLCTTCTKAVDNFIVQRRTNLKKRGLVK